MNKYRSSESLGDRYPARRLLDLIGDKWTPIVLYCLSGGVRRFNEMQHRIPDISKKMLIQVLRKLEQTLWVSPAMEAGISQHVWSITEIVGLAERSIRIAA